MTDWEARALPTEARCRAWAERGGRWVVSHYSGLMGAPFLTIVFPESGRVQPQKDDVIWRPWMGQNPTPWSDFYAATHPPIPEGLERIGEWRTGLGAPRDLPLVFLEDGTIMRDPGLILGSVWFCEVRRILPAIPAGWEAVGEWHDTLSPCSEVYDWTLLQDGRIVQRGETFRGKDERIMGVHIRRVLPDVDWGDVPRGVTLMPHDATHVAVWRGCGMLGLIHQQPDCKWTARKTDGSGLCGNQPSLPAAIVALTGRRK